MGTSLIKFKQAALLSNYVKYRFIGLLLHIYVTRILLLYTQKLGMKHTQKALQWPMIILKYNLGVQKLSGANTIVKF